MNMNVDTVNQNGVPDGFLRWLKVCIHLFQNEEDSLAMLSQKHNKQLSAYEDSLYFSSWYAKSSP